MASSSKKVTKDLDQVFQLNDALFTNFTLAKMLQGDNISQLSSFITDMLCKPQMYKKRLMVNILNSLLSSWEETTDVYDLLEGCFTFLSVAGNGQEIVPALRCDDCDNFCLLATALLNLCKDGNLKADVGSKVVKSVLNFKDSEDKLVVVRRVWSEKDVLGLPIGTVEELVRDQPILVEEPVVDMALAVARAAAEDCEDVLEMQLGEPAIVSLVEMSVRSTLVFQMVTSILHSLVCRAPLNSNLLRLSQEVVEAVSRSCGPCGIVPLLPPHQRALALCLQVDPQLLPDGPLRTRWPYYAVTSEGAAKIASKSSVLQMIAAALAADPAGTSMLLVYYPCWMKLLSTQVMLA